MSEWASQVTAAEKIVCLFRDYADVLIDEVHLVLWLKKRLNYALGGQQPIPHRLIYHCVELYQFLGQMTVDVDGNTYPFIQAVTQPSLLSQAQFQTHLKHLAEATGPLSQLISAFSLEEQMAISAYLKNEGSSVPLCILNADKATQDTFAIYKIQLTELLAQTARRRVNVHYGASHQTSLDPMTRAVAIPYCANNQPNEGCQFGHVLESINYTIQSLLISGLTHEMVREVIQQLQASALQELQQSNDPSLTLDDTWVARGFNQMTLQLDDIPAFSAIDLDNEAQFVMIAKALRHNQALLFDVLKRRILPKISMDTQILHSNAYHHVDMVHSCQGTTGSAGNHATYHPRLRFNPQTNMGNLWFVVHLLKEKQPSIPIRGIDFQETASFIQQLFSVSTKPMRARAIMDISATFQGISNQTVAAALAEYFQQHSDQATPKIRYILFYNEQNAVCAYHVTRQTIEELKLSKETADIDLQLDCTVDERMTFYDNLHAIGANIAQGDLATGIALVDEQTTLDAFIQGVMRMRGLQEQQSIELIVPSKWASNSFDDIIQHMARTQQQALSQELYEAACDQLTNVLRNDLKCRLLSPASLDEKCRLADAFRSFFIETPSLDWFKTQGGLHLAQRTQALLELQQAHQLARWQQIITTTLTPAQRPSFDDEYDALKRQMTSILKEMLVVCEETYTTSLSHLETQVETMKERLQQHQVAEQLPATIREAPFQFRFNEDLLMAYDQQEQIKPLQALFNALPSREAHDKPYFSDQLYVSQHFYQCFIGQTQFIGRYQKPVLVMLFRIHSDDQLDCLLVSQQEVAKLIPIVQHSRFPIWLSDTRHTLLSGNRPERVLTDARYSTLVTQVRFYNGEFAGLLDEPGALSWLQEQTSQKLAIFKRCILPYRDLLEQEIEQLQEALSEKAPIYADIAARAPHGGLATINWQKTYPEQAFTDEDIEQLTALAKALADANEHWENDDWLAIDKQTKYALSPRSLGLMAYYVDELQQLRALMQALETDSPVLWPLSRVFLAESYQNILQRFTGERLDFSSQLRLDQSSLHALKMLSVLPLMQHNARIHRIITRFESPIARTLQMPGSLQSLSSISSQSYLYPPPRQQMTPLAVNIPNGLGIQEAMVQWGHDCKTTAIATVESYYAKQLGYEAIPLRKDGGRHTISIRELAKQHGSIQGELLEIGQLEAVFHDLGMKTALLDFRDDLAFFQQEIRERLAQGHVPIVFFNVSRDTGLPTNEGIPEEREHAAIINDYAPETDALEIIHWGKIYQTTATAMYQSSFILPITRQPEFYEAVDCALRLDANKKYEQRNLQKSRSAHPVIKKSITPHESTGFRCKLLVAQRPTLDQIQQHRQWTLPKNLIHKLQQILTALTTKLKNELETQPEDKILLMFYPLAHQLTLCQSELILLPSIQLDRVVRVIQRAHRVIHCYGHDKPALPFALADLDTALQHMTPNRRSSRLPPEHWSLLEDADVYALLSELTCLIQRTPFPSQMLVLLRAPTLKKTDLFKIIREAKYIDDALLMVTPFIQHKQTDLDVLIDMMSLPVFSNIIDQMPSHSTNVSAIDASAPSLINEAKHAFAKKIQSSLTQSHITKEQLCSISLQANAYLGDNLTTWSQYITHLVRHELTDLLSFPSSLIVPLLMDKTVAQELHSDVLLQLIKQVKSHVDAQEVIRLFIEHPQTNVDVLMAMMTEPAFEMVLSYNNCSQYLQIIWHDIDQSFFDKTLRLFKIKLTQSLDSPQVSRKQLLKISTNITWYMHNNSDQTQLIHRLLHHPNTTESVLINTFRCYGIADVATAEAVLSSPYMSTVHMESFMKTLSKETIGRLCVSAIWLEHPDLKVAFYSNRYCSDSGIMQALLDDILADEPKDDAKVYSKLKQLCQTIRPLESMDVYAELAKSPRITENDLLGLLTTTKLKHVQLHRFVICLLDSPAVEASTSTFELVWHYCMKLDIKPYDLSAMIPFAEGNSDLLKHIYCHPKSNTAVKKAVSKLVSEQTILTWGPALEDGQEQENVFPPPSPSSK